MLLEFNESLNALVRSGFIGPIEPFVQWLERAKTENLNWELDAFGKDDKALRETRKRNKQKG